MKRMMRQRVYKACKSRGLTLQRAAYKGLQSVLAQCVADAWCCARAGPAWLLTCARLCAGVWMRLGVFVSAYVRACACVGCSEPDLEAGVATLLDHLQEHLERHGGTPTHAAAPHARVAACGVPTCPLPCTPRYHAGAGATRPAHVDAGVMNTHVQGLR